jgi:hypothetical protein
MTEWGVRMPAAFLPDSRSEVSEVEIATMRPVSAEPPEQICPILLPALVVH